MSKGLVVSIVLLVTITGVAVGIYGYMNSLRSESVLQETALNAQYLANQNYLSFYISGFYEQLGIVKYKSDKLNEILVDYAKGRSFGKAGQSDQAAFINAVVEAVPDLKGLDIADKMMDYVTAGREGYRAVQDKLLDMLKRYDAWRQDGYIQSWIIEHIVGVPSNRLQARIGDDVVEGEEARKYMYRIVLASQAKDAYKSGIMEPLMPGPSEKKKD